MNAAANALQTIRQETRQSLAHLQGVTIAMAEQSQAGAVLAGNVENVASVVDETHGASNTAVAASAEIAALANDLQASVSRFRT